MGRFFSIGELCRSNVADLKGLNNAPNTMQKMNMEKLIFNVLDPLRAAYGKPINVSSGFRCETLNKLIGGKKNSQHMKGQAADITVWDKKENKKIFDLIQKLGLEFDQLISEQTCDDGCGWVHVSFNEDNNRNEILYL